MFSSTFSVAIPATRANLSHLRRQLAAPAAILETACQIANRRIYSREAKPADIERLLAEAVTNNQSSVAILGARHDPFHCAALTSTFIRALQEAPLPVYATTLVGPGAVGTVQAYRFLCSSAGFVAINFSDAEITQLLALRHIDELGQRPDEPF